MIRTQVYLPEEMKELIDIRAAQGGLAKAEVIRRALKAGLRAVGREGEMSVAESLDKISQIKGEGPVDLAENMDEYLYGDKSEYAQENSD